MPADYALDSYLRKLQDRVRRLEVTVARERLQRGGATTYDNSASGLTSDDAQAAIDELAGRDLDSLSDVNVPAPDDGDVVTWNDTAGEWQAQAPGAGAYADLSDVDLAGLSDGDFAAYDSASGLWQPTGAPSGTVPDGSTAGDLLIWDGSSWAAGTGGGVPSGSSFPGSPSTNDLYYRTDLALLFYYDGTRWLCTCLHEKDLSVSGTLLPASGALPNIGRAPIYVGSCSDVWVDKVVFTSYPNAPNNGSAYWTLNVAKRDAANTGTVIASRTTNADTAANWTLAEVSVAGLLGGTSTYKELDFYAGNNGGPGTLYASALVMYRLVAT